ncbi:MAG: LD-carboxypeptidase [Bacteroidia bacterium]|nr:LD-carboxypeptidase [Bacteroidota bacterium]MBP6413884.1 LD-carboxypeptidase [Bacteroidia bacterium]
MPPRLKQGDKVMLISSARKVLPEEVNSAVEVLKSWGLIVEFGDNLFEQFNQFAGSDLQRTNDLQNAINDESIKAILFARGGYGTVRIVDAINFFALTKNPKWIIGFSDITVLHAHLEKNFGIATLHSPMAFNFQKTPEEVLEKIKSMLFEGTQQYKVAAHPMNRKGESEGILIGGNLSIIYSLLGSVSDSDTDGKILFLEDLDEYLYHIDRMLQSLKRAGKLAKLAGLIIGGMNDMKDNLIPFGQSPEEIILDAVKEYDYPVCFGFPSGHLPVNFPLLLGDKIHFSVLEEVCINSVSANGNS